MAKLKHPKEKGDRLERDVVELFEAAGMYGERMWGSNGNSRGLPKEVDVLVKLPIETYYQNGTAGKYDRDFYIQCKSVAKLADRFVPSENIDAVVYKENRGKKYILMELEEFLKWLA